MQTIIFLSILTGSILPNVPDYDEHLLLFCIAPVLLCIAEELTEIIGSPVHFVADFCLFLTCFNLQPFLYLLWGNC